MAERPYVTPRNRQDWRRWLQRHHKTSPSIWLVLFKKGSGKENLSVIDASEEALCFGWIDSLPGKVDEARFKLLVSPRKSGSSWSKVNRERVARLTRAGRMTPSGLAKVEAAKRDGSWDRLDAVERLEIPPDLERAFGRARRARAKFLAFSPSSRRGILEWLQSTKRPETRTVRIREIVTMAALGLRANFPVDRKKITKSTAKKKSARNTSPATYFKCKQCLGYIKLSLKSNHVCAVPTEQDLIPVLDEDALEAWFNLREFASGFGPNRIYASAKAIMFARRICYLFVRPKAKGLELCFFLDRRVKHAMIKRVQEYSRTKFAHTATVTHRDQIEEPLIGWLREAWNLAE